MNFAAPLGLFLGTASGLIPGIHPNMLAIILVNSSVNNKPLVIFTIALTYSFLSVIPAIHLSTPDSDTALALHPSQKYSQKGKSHEAVLLTLIGSLTSLFLMILLLPLLKRILKPLYQSIANIIPLLLLATALFLILHQRKKLFAFIIFALSGVLGYFSLNYNLANPLLPLFTGLFGLPSLIINSGSDKIQQKITEPSLSKKSLSTVLQSLFYGSFFSFLPSLGSAQAATVQSQFSKNTSKRDFMILTGCLNMINLIVSVVTLLELNMARNGAVAAIKSLDHINLDEISNLFYIALILSLPCTLICIFASRGFIKIKNKISAKKLSWTIVIFLIIMTFALAKIPGIIILALSSFLGYLPYKFKTTKTTLMGSLMVPTMIYYFSRMF